MNKLLLFFVGISSSLSFTEAKVNLVEQWTTAPILKQGEIAKDIKAFTQEDLFTTDVIVRVSVSDASPYDSILRIYRSGSYLKSHYIRTTSTLDQLLNANNKYLALPNSKNELFVIKLPIPSKISYLNPSSEFRINFDHPIDKVEWSASDADLLLAQSSKGYSYLIQLKQVEEYGRTSTIFEPLEISNLGKYKFFPGGFAYFKSNDQNLNLNVVRCETNCVTSVIPLPTLIKEISAFSYTKGNRPQGSVIDNSFLIFDESTGSSIMINADTGRTINTFQPCPAASCRFLAFEAESTSNTAINMLVVEYDGQLAIVNLFSGESKSKYNNLTGYNLFEPKFVSDQVFGPISNQKEVWIDFKKGSARELYTNNGIVRLKYNATWLFTPLSPFQDSKIEVIPVLEPNIAQSQILTGVGIFQSAKLLGYSKNGRAMVSTDWYLKGEGNSSLIVWSTGKSFETSLIEDVSGSLITYEDSNDGVYAITNDGRIRYIRFEW